MKITNLKYSFKLRRLPAGSRRKLDLGVHMENLPSNSMMRTPWFNEFSKSSDRAGGAAALFPDYHLSRFNYFNLSSGGSIAGSPRRTSCSPKRVDSVILRTVLRICVFTIPFGIKVRLDDSGRRGWGTGARGTRVKFVECLNVAEVSEALWKSRPKTIWFTREKEIERKFAAISIWWISFWINRIKSISRSKIRNCLCNGTNT